MILPDFILPSRVNQLWTESGIDSFEYCVNKQHFKSYSYPIEYQYNSRGFRDQEWPDTKKELQNAIWCVGDSFTVGIGSTLAHTWPYILQQKIGCRVINTSMDGASNDWIFRKSVDIINTLRPQALIIHWSYIERSEVSISMAFADKWEKFYKCIRDSSWPESSDFDLLPKHLQHKCVTYPQGLWPITDEDRILMTSSDLIEIDIQRTLNYINNINQLYTNTKIIHSFIPNFLPRNYKKEVNAQLTMSNVIPEFKQLDFARDYHHYDIQTSNYFTSEILKFLNQH
jgi:hypothetical protein